MSTRIEWSADPGRLAELGERWDALATSPFMAAWWLDAWRSAFAADDEPRLCLAWRGDRLVGGLPLVSRGGELAAMANDHSPRFEPLATDTHALEAVLRAALEASGGTLTLPNVPLDSDLCAAPQRGFRALQSPSQVSPVVDTAGSFDDWYALSRPRWGYPLERYRRKMQREYDAELRNVEAPEDVDAELDAGLAVEASGWKGREGTAVLSSPETEAFYRAVAHTSARGGELRMSSIRLDGRVVAFDLCLLRDRRLYLLKTGFEESFRKLAPGLVLRLGTVEACFEQRLEAFDLLGDRSDWKAKFATSERPHVTWTGYALTRRAVGRYAVRRGGRALKRVRDTARRLRPAEAVS